MRIRLWPGVRLSVWEKQNPEADPATSPVVNELTRELHRRTTHLDTIRSAPEDEVPTDAWVMVVGEVQGLQGALGIALGGKVAGGDADERARAHYRSWAAGHASEWNRCRCEACTAVLKGGAGQ
ncbi:hypothetical protein [Streptomyces alfalfae]